MNAVASTAPDLLLVDDDAPTRRYFELALRELGVGVRLCTSVGEALQLLHERTPCYVVSDLHLPDGSPSRLAEAVQHLPADSRPTFVLMTGGLNATVEQQFRQLGVQRFWSKPVSLDQLRRLVMHPPADAATDAHQQDAVTRFFHGNQRMFTAFRAQCMAQLRDDLIQADAAVAGADSGAVAQLMHNLKTVLQLIGQPEEAAMAVQIEQGLALPTASTPPEGWVTLRQRLHTLATTEGAHG